MPLLQARPNPVSAQQQRLQRVLKLHVPVIVRLADRKILLSEVMRLGVGAIIEFVKSSSEPLELMINNKVVGQGDGESGENFGLRITKVGTPRPSSRRSADGRPSRPPPKQSDREAEVSSERSFAGVPRAFKPSHSFAITRLGCGLIVNWDVAFILLPHMIQQYPSGLPLPSDRCIATMRRLYVPG